MPDLAFIVTQTPPTINSDDVVAAAAEFGLEWTALPQENPDGPLSFGFGATTILVMQIAAMHPDIPQMPVGPTGADPEELKATQGHLIVTALGLEGDEATRDTEMAVFTTVVMQATDAVGAMLGHNTHFHKAEIFHQLVISNAAEGQPPLPVLVSVTVAGDGSGRMSFHSHGMGRYGNEDIYVTCPVEGNGAVPFTYDMISWFFELETPIPTGDSIGRDESEQLTVQRVPSPADAERIVVRLDLD